MRLVLAALYFAGTSGHAQTLDEAVRANLALSIDLCIGSLGSEEEIVGAFQSAGFQQGATTSRGSTQVYRFDAPADTVSANVLSYSCEIDTTHLGVSDAIPLVRAVLERSVPGQVTESQQVGVSRAGGSPCQVFILRSPERLPFNIYVGSLGADPGYTCVEDGTARVWFEIPG